MALSGHPAMSADVRCDGVNSGRGPDRPKIDANDPKRTSTGLAVRCPLSKHSFEAHDAIS